MPEHWGQQHDHEQLRPGYLTRPAYRVVSLRSWPVSIEHHDESVESGRSVSLDGPVHRHHSATNHRIKSKSHTLDGLST